MRSHNLKRLELLQPKQILGLFLVEDMQGDTVSVQNAMTGFDNSAMPREEARLLVEGQPCLWIGRYDGHVEECDRHAPQPRKPRFEMGGQL